MTVPDLAGGFQQRTPGGGADDRYHAIDAAKLFRRLGNDTRDLGVVEDVAHDRRGLTAKASDDGGDAVCAILFQVHQPDIAPHLGQKAGCGLAHPLATADNQGFFAAQAEQ